jgi:hypothetical protein
VSFDNLKVLKPLGYITDRESDVKPPRGEANGGNAFRDQFLGPEAIQNFESGNRSLILSALARLELKSGHPWLVCRSQTVYGSVLPPFTTARE